MTDQPLASHAETMPNLHQLMSHQRDANSCIAFDNQQQFLWGDFRCQVYLLSQRLSKRPEQRWALYTPSSYQFAMALMALWHAGKSAVIPGDNLSATVEHIRPVTDAFLGDFADQPSRPIMEKMAFPDDQTILFNELDPEQCRLTVLTSGSTGSPKFIPFQLRQLETELQILESLWGHQLQQSSIISSVSHQHLYGLTFRLCWPLAAGRPFADKNCHYMEALTDYCQTAKKLSLVTSPSHLSRLPDTLPWQQLRSHWQQVFCSTGPLSLAASEDASLKFGLPITEIFGSSETGVMAWRHQQQANHWQALPGIHIACDADSNALRLQSPLLEPPSQWLQTADKIALINPKQFLLHGRIDRIIKIEGKRVSLSAMEKRLEAHPWINSAKAFVLPSSSRRSDLAIVATLNQDALTFIRQQGKRQLNLQFRQHLKSHFENPLLPRRWRYPASLPENSQGKITQQALSALFQHKTTPIQATNNYDG